MPVSEFLYYSVQAGGVPTGNHGLYHRFSIEAVTLEVENTSSAVLVCTALSRA